MAGREDKLEIIESDGETTTTMTTTVNSRHHIFQTDETITVLCTEETQILSHDNTETPASDNQRSDTNQHRSRANQKAELSKTSESLASEKSQESGEPFPKSILTNCDSDEAKVSTAKKSVSFETDDSIKKFISGEEIVDQRNPFRSANEEEPDHSYRITKLNKAGGIPRRISVNGKAPKATIDESDYISKEDILKQSKYVPVYIRNPDRVLTYDKSVLERLSTTTSPVPNGREIKRVPVPTPRVKAAPVKPGKPIKPVKEKKKTKQHRVDSRYPDLADIKVSSIGDRLETLVLTNFPFIFQVKTGTDLDESLYDHNEVVLNAKKFDSLVQRTHFSSNEDIDEAVEKAMDDETDGKSQEKDDSKEEEKKSYTNTVNSKEFREFLKKKGLLLFPVKANGAAKEPPPKQPSPSVRSSLPIVKLRQRSTDQVDDAGVGDKKKTVFRRLSSIFSKSKTSPKENDHKVSFTSRKDENGGSAIKRVFLERSSFPNESNRSILANNEFVTSNNFLKNGVRFSRDDDDEDKKSSISSVLTAAADDEVFEETPQPVRRGKPDTNSYRKIDMNRSKLYRLNDEVVKPRAFHPNRAQPAVVNHSTPIRRTSDREFSPVAKPKPAAHGRDSSSIPMRQHMSNGNSSSFYAEPVKLRETSTLQRSKPINTAPKASEAPGNPGIDPFTFAKIHEIKRKTDEVLLNKSLTLENGQPKLNNQNFVRNSQQRSTIEGYRRPHPPQLQPQELNHRHTNNLTLPRQPPRSQSVLDNMTNFKDSLYGEVRYRQPNGRDVNVIMRRPESSSLDKQQIMQKIYEYYRKSVNNTPVSFQDKRNLHIRSQSTNTPTSFAEASPLAKGAPRLPSDYHSWTATRKPTISESDNSEFFAESISSRDYNRFVGEKERVLSYKSPHRDQNQIYDVVYGTIGRDPRSELYAQVRPRKDENPYERRTHRGSTMSPTSTRPASSARTTPIPLYSPSKPVHQMDIVYNNQIYRPIAALRQTPVASTIQRFPQHAQVGYANFRGSVKAKELLTPESDGSETGEVQRIMQNHRFGECRVPWAFHFQTTLMGLRARRR